MNTALEYSTRVVQEGGHRCKKSTLNDLVHLTPLRIPLMNPPEGVCSGGRSFEPLVLKLSFNLFINFLIYRMESLMLQELKMISLLYFYIALRCSLTLYPLQPVFFVPQNISRPTSYPLKYTVPCAPFNNNQPASLCPSLFPCSLVQYLYPLHFSRMHQYLFTAFL